MFKKLLFLLLSTLSLNIFSGEEVKTLKAKEKENVSFDYHEPPFVIINKQISKKEDKT